MKKSVSHFRPSDLNKQTQISKKLFIEQPILLSSILSSPYTLKNIWYRFWRDRQAIYSDELGIKDGDNLTPFINSLPDGNCFDLILLPGSYSIRGTVERRSCIYSLDYFLRYAPLRTCGLNLINQNAIYPGTFIEIDASLNQCFLDFFGPTVYVKNVTCSSWEKIIIENSLIIFRDNFSTEMDLEILECQILTQSSNPITLDLSNASLLNVVLATKNTDNLILGYCEFLEFMGSPQVLYIESLDQDILKLETDEFMSDSWIELNHLFLKPPSGTFSMFFDCASFNIDTLFIQGNLEISLVNFAYGFINKIFFSSGGYLSIYADEDSEITIGNVVNADYIEILGDGYVQILS